jgi:hypothetical protein
MPGLDTIVSSGPACESHLTPAVSVFGAIRTRVPLLPAQFLLTPAKHTEASSPSAIQASRSEKFTAGRCRAFDKCARLRTSGRGKRSSQALGWILRPTGYGRHEKPARTRCLTSVARCLCSQSNSQKYPLPPSQIRRCYSPPTSALPRQTSAKSLPVKRLNLPHVSCRRNAWHIFDSSEPAQKPSNYFKKPRPIPFHSRKNPKKEREDAQRLS